MAVVNAKRLPPVDTLTLPPLARFLASYGAGFEKLGLGVPRAWQMVENAETKIVVNDRDVDGDELIGGLPAATYDRHTSPGSSRSECLHEAFRNGPKKKSATRCCASRAHTSDRPLITGRALDMSPIAAARSQTRKSCPFEAAKARLGE